DILAAHRTGERDHQLLDTGGVGHGAHSHVASLGLALHDLLDFHGRDLLATRVEDFVVASQYLELSQVAQDADVTRIEPAVAKHLLRRDGIVHVATRHARSVHANPTGRAVGHRLAALVDDLDVDARQYQAVSRRFHRRDLAHLIGAVAIDDFGR